MRLVLNFALAALAAAPAAAQLTAVTPFTGNLQESFEGPQVLFTPCLTYPAFGGAATLCTPTGSYCHTTTGWGYVCTIFPQTGSKFFASTSGPTEITFSGDIFRFGGYFGSNSPGGDATFDFYDASNNLISSETALFPNDCQWHWFGWQSCSTAIRKVVVTGINTTAGGYVDMDGLQADSGLPPTCGPSAYCTAGTSTAGCAASISATANPSASFSTPCQVNVSGVEGQRSGIIFYGLGALPQPWCAVGGSTFLCVKAPTQRTYAANSGGTAGACDGGLSLDWNAFHGANPGSLGTPFASGQKVYLQAWFRDPPACKTTTMSNGLEMTIQ